MGCRARRFRRHRCLEGVGQPKADANIDWGALGESDGGGSNDPFFEETATRTGARARVGGGGGGDDVDYDFTVFDGFGQDNKPVRGGGGKQPAAALSWDEERQQWERANKSSFGLGGFGSRGGFGGGGGASPWDLRSAGLKTPASRRAFRQQAEKVRRPPPRRAPRHPHRPRSPTPPRPPTPPHPTPQVFNDNISSSLFQSPSMARLKRQTDDLFASVSSTISSVVPTSVTSFFSSWWS